MKIKSDSDRSFYDRLSWLYRTVTGKKMVSVYLLMIFIGGLILGLLVSGFFGTLDKPAPFIYNIFKDSTTLADIKNALMNLRAENINIPSNVINGAVSNPREISIDIKFKDFQKIVQKRNEAMAYGLLVASDADYVPATVTYDNRTVNVKMRLKGDLAGPLERGQMVVSYKRKRKRYDFWHGSIFNPGPPGTK